MGENNTMQEKPAKMTIARALKEKERIARRLAKAKELFAASNCVRADEDREVDIKEVYENMRDLQRQYVAIKRAIAVANAGISPSLVEMLAVRAELAFYTNLRCKESEMSEELTQLDGDERPVRRRVKIVYDSFITPKARQEMIETLTTRLDDLQDEVDNFNATHFVEMVS